MFCELNIQDIVILSLGLVNIFAALAAFIHHPNKPALKLELHEEKLLRQIRLNLMQDWRS